MQPREYKVMYQLEDKHWWFTAKRLFIKTYLNFLPKKKNLKILDIGCGTGKNLEMLQNFGQPQGIDAFTSAISFCKKRKSLKTKKASASQLPFKNNNFNLITLLDVLYHKGVKNDLQVLKEAYRALKSSGFLLITDCAHQFLWGSHDISMHARQRYSKKELISKVNQAGFKVKKASYIYFFTFPLFIINRLLKKFIFKKSSSDIAPINPVINQALIFILNLESKLLKYFNLPIGSSIIVLAQK